MTRAVAIDRAKSRASNLYKSPAFRKTYVDGVRAALDGKTHDDCPYRLDGKGTWRRTWRRAWLRGFDSARA